MVAWGCWYAASQVNVSEGKQWIQDNAMKAVASHVLESGEYKDGLIANAVTVSDRHDSLLCPNKFNVSFISRKDKTPHLVFLGLLIRPERTFGGASLQREPVVTHGAV